MDETYTSCQPCMTIVTYMSLLYEELYMHSLLYQQKLYMHEYYVHTIMAVLVLVVTLYKCKLLYRLEPLVMHLLIPILMVSDVQTHNVASN